MKHVYFCTHLIFRSKVGVSAGTHVNPVPMHQPCPWSAPIASPTATSEPGWLPLFWVRAGSSLFPLDTSVSLPDWGLTLSLLQVCQGQGRTAQFPQCHKGQDRDIGKGRSRVGQSYWSHSDVSSFPVQTLMASWVGKGWCLVLEYPSLACSVQKVRQTANSHSWLMVHSSRESMSKEKLYGL